MKTPLHVLLVEDNPLDAELIVHELQRKGYDLTYTRVQTKDEFIENLVPSLDIILADYSLPQFSGADALILLKERYPDIPLIIITGVLGDEKAAEVMKLGAVDYLLKDRLARLSEAIKHALQRRDLKLKENEQESILRENEEKYRLIFENSMDALLLTKPDGDILAANPAACKMFGRSEEEIVNGGRDLIIDRDDPRLPRVLEERIRTGNYAGELTFLRNDGTKFPGDITTSLFTDRQGETRTSMIIRDISERKQAEKIILLKNRIFEIAYHASSLTKMLDDYIEEFKKISGCEAIGIRILDREGNIPYLSYCGFPKIFYENESHLNIHRDKCFCVYAITGSINHDMPFISRNGSFWSNNTSKLLAGISETEIGPTRNVCNQMGYESVALIPIRTPTGIIGLIQLNDTRENMVPLDLVQIMEEISLPLEETIRRMQTQESLQKSEEGYRNLFQTMVQGVIYQDNSGNIISANSAAEKILGLSMDQMQGRTSFDHRWRAIHEDGSLFPGENHPSTLALKTGNQVKGVVMGVYNPDENLVRWIMIDATPSFLPMEMEPDSVYTIFTDITELKHAEEDLRHFNEDLEKQVFERTRQLKASLQEKEMLLKEIHHRVKNNMQVISGLLLLQSQTATDEATRLMFKESQDRIRSIALVHEQLYRSDNLSQIEYGDYLRRMFGTLFESYKVDPRLVSVVIDVEEVMISIEKAVPCSLIVNELLSNSLKHAFPDGQKGEIRIGFTLGQGGEMYSLDYRDNGVGFPEEFDPKQTVTLGMSLLFGLTGQLKGTLTREEGEGVHLIISFPSKELRGSSL